MCVFTLCFSPKLITSTKKVFISILPSIWKRFSNWLFLLCGRTAGYTFLLFIPKIKNPEMLLWRGWIRDCDEKKSMCTQLVRRWNSLVMTSQILACHPLSELSSHLVYWSRSSVEDSYRGPWLLPPSLLTLVHTYKHSELSRTHMGSLNGAF